MANIWEWIGLDAANVAKNEVWDPDKERVERQFGDRVGDLILSGLTGTNRKAEIADLVKANYTKELRRKLGPELALYANVPGGQNIGDLSTQRPEDVRTTLALNKKLHDARQTALGAGMSPELLDGLTNVGAIQGAQVNYLKDKKKAEITDARNFKTRLINDQRKYEADVHARTSKENAIIRAEASVENAKIRAEDRKIRNEEMMLRHNQLMQNAADNKELRIMELDGRKASRRADMLQALFGLGAAFAA